MQVRQLRRLLSRRRAPPIDAVLATPGLVGRFVVLLQAAGCWEVQLEAAWVLTNLTSGSAEQCAPVLQAGAPRCDTPGVSGGAVLLCAPAHTESTALR
jgi:hypothetical protein